MLGLEKITIDCNTMFGLRANVRLLSGEIFFRVDISVVYWVRQLYSSSFGLNCTTFWLFSDPYGTVEFKQKCVVIVYLQNLLYFYNI